MGYRFQKRDLTSKQAFDLISQCSVEEKLTYFQEKKKVMPKKFTLALHTALTMTVPYHIAIKNGYRVSDELYYRTNELKFKPGRNICKIINDSENFRPFTGEFRDYQTDIINELIGDLEEFFTTTIGVFPGWGKSMAALYLIWRLGYRGIVLIPTTKILDGWVKSREIFLKLFKVWIVGVNDYTPDCDIILCMIERVHLISYEILSTVGTLVIDEMHMMCTQLRAEAIMTITPKYVIPLSATLEKPNGFHKISHLIAGEHGSFLISKNPYDIYIVDTNLDIEEEHNKNGIVLSAYRNAMCSNSRYQEIVCNILMLNSDYHKTMCITMVKEGIPQLANRIRNCGITADSMYGTKGDYKNSQVLIATQQKGGTGFDESTGCKDFYSNPIKSNLMIFLNTTPNPTVYEQTRGRVMRSDNPIVVFLRNNNKKSFDHIKNLIPWFKQTNATIHYTSYSNLIFPRIKQIFTRKVEDDFYYKVINSQDRNDFETFKILDRNIKEADEEGYRVFYTKNEAMFYENLFDTNSSSYLLKMNKLNVVTIYNDGYEKLFCICPICDFQIDYIVKTQKIEEIKGFKYFENVFDNSDDKEEILSKVNNMNFNFTKIKGKMYEKNDQYLPTIKEGDNILAYCVFDSDLNVMLTKGKDYKTIKILKNSVYILTEESRTQWYHGFQANQNTFVYQLC